MTHGNWLVLENCHLDIKLTMRLCVEYQHAIDAEIVHDDFRLWCVTAPTPEFPIAVLRHAVKFTYNPPNNLKDRITNHGGYLSDEKYVRWTFALVTFHAILQERQTFDEGGWTRPYSFNDYLLREAIIYSKLLVKLADDTAAFDGVSYLVTECIYGGLVVDPIDRRLLRALFQHICCNSNELFFENGNIRIPAEPTTDKCTKAIESLSRRTMAADVGLHANSEFLKGFRRCDYILSIISQTQPLSSASESIDSEVDSVQIQSIDILKRLPNAMPLNANSDETFAFICRNETMRLNALLQCIRASLTELGQAIDGHIHMGNDLHRIYGSLKSNRIPFAWMPFIYRTSKTLAAFVHDLIARVEFFRQWHNDGAPVRFWFSAFFNPVALVTTIKTIYANTNGIDLADVCIQCVFSGENEHNESIAIEVSTLCRNDCNFNI